MKNKKHKKTILNLHSVIFFLAVFLDTTKMAINSSDSFSNGSTVFLLRSVSSIINSSQKNDSSISSKTMLNFDIKLAFD